jgi:hypothetical protein
LAVGYRKCEKAKGSSFMTERICYLHLGLTKTGSTALQAAFDGYSDADLRYADLGHPNHSTPLTLLFSDDPFRHRQINTIRLYSRRQAEKRIDRARSRLLAQVTQDRKSVIFSGETIPQRLHPHELAALRDFFLRHFDRIQVTVYVRPWLSLAPSAWQERVKNGSDKFEVPIPRYRHLLKPLINAFGAEATSFVPFARDQLKNGDVIDDFAERVGIDAARLPRPESNLSHSLEATAVLFAFNQSDAQRKANKKSVQARDHRADALYQFGQGKIGFAPALLQQVQRDHQSDLDWASRLLNYDMLGKSSPVDRPLSNAADVLQIADENIAAARGLIFASGKRGAIKKNRRNTKPGLLQRILRRIRNR